MPATLIVLGSVLSSCGGFDKSYCFDDPQSCASADLCSYATLENKWEKRTQYTPYVSEAKKRGLSCSVSVLNACPSSLTDCSDYIICVGATTKKYYSPYDKSKWSKHPEFLKYVNEAKARDLACPAL